MQPKKRAARPSASGVGGGAIVRGIADRHRRRETLALLERSLKATAQVHDPKVWRPIVDAMVAGAKDSIDPRGAARCAGVLATLRSQDIQIAEYLDKAERLDGGDPTERTVLTVTMDDAG